VKKIRIYIILLILIVIPIGFGLKFYTGPLANWANNYAAGIFYEIFWIFVFFFLFPKKENMLRIAIGVFVGTSILEFMQ